MMTSFKAFAIVSITGMLTAAVPAMAASLDSSSADALSARFTADGFVTTLPPVAHVKGSAPPPYDKQISLPAFDKVLNIADKIAPPPAFYINLTRITDHVTGSGIGVDNFSSEGDTKVATAALALNLNPPPPTATGIVPFVPLQVIASAVQSSASFSDVVPRPPVVAGTSNFGALTISGTLLGGKTVAFEGTPPPNHVLFSNAEVTITLNEQLIVATTVTCVVDQGCTVIPGGIFVKALRVSLTNANIFGRIVSGDFFLGESEASGG
jgi:hypothetical protein